MPPGIEEARLTYIQLNQHTVDKEEYVGCQDEELLTMFVFHPPSFIPLLGLLHTFPTV
jgi:hypothetical protein